MDEYFSSLSHSTPSRNTYFFFFPSFCSIQVFCSSRFLSWYFSFFFPFFLLFFLLPPSLTTSLSSSNLSLNDRLISTMNAQVRTPSVYLSTSIYTFSDVQDHNQQQDSRRNTTPEQGGERKRSKQGTSPTALRFNSPSSSLATYHTTWMANRNRDDEEQDDDCQERTSTQTCSLFGCRIRKKKKTNSVVRTDD